MIIIKKPFLFNIFQLKDNSKFHQIIKLNIICKSSSYLYITIIKIKKIVMLIFFCYKKNYNLKITLKFHKVK
jgi:hypothetical protein